MLEVVLADDQLAWALGADRSWHRVPARLGVNAHRWFEAQAHARAAQVDLDAPALVVPDGGGHRHDPDDLALSAGDGV